MTNHATIGFNDHGVAEIMKGEVMPATQLNSFVFEELSELFDGNSFLFHGNLLVSISRPLWIPKANEELSS